MFQPILTGLRQRNDLKCEAVRQPLRLAYLGYT